VVERPHPSLFQVSTTATTRIVGWDAISSAISIAQAVCSVTRPNSVLLTRPDCYPEVLASTRLLHHPFDAVLLYTEGEKLEEAVSRELIRLSPRGQNVPAQVIVIGAVHAQVLHDIANLGFTTLQLQGHDLWDTVERIAEYDLGTENQHALLVSVDPMAGGVVAGGYAAYSGTPVLFANEQGLFSSSLSFLRRHPRTKVIVVAPEAYLPNVVHSEIRSLGSKVEGWIGGSDAFEMSVDFAKFRHPKTRFGWGRRERSAAAVTFVPIERWPYGVAAAALSLRGRNTPLLLTKRDYLPPSIENGLLALRARHDSGVQSHGFLVGSLDAITYQVQMRMHLAMTFESDPHR
jgi:putative cell wall-binding protein